MCNFLIILAALSLGACTTTQAPSSEMKPKTNILAVVQKAIAKVSPLKPKLYVTDVLGQDEQWLRAKLGEPSFVRAELEAHIWMYKNKNCILNLFLYSKSKQNPELSVLHFDARNLAGGNMDRNTCLATY